MIVNPEISIIDMVPGGGDNTSAPAPSPIITLPTASTASIPATITNAIDPSATLHDAFKTQFPAESKLIPAAQIQAMSTAIASGMTPYINESDRQIMMMVTALATTVGVLQGQVSALNAASAAAKGATSILGKVEGAATSIFHAVESVGKTVVNTVVKIGKSIGHFIKHLF